MFKSIISHKIVTIIKIERERSDLTVQLIGLTERLEEAEGSSESVVRILCFHSYTLMID